MSHALDRFLEQYAFRHPVPATRAHIRLHDHELPGWSREAREDELDEFEALTVALDEEHDAEPDDATLATDRRALEAQLARASMDVRQLAFESRFFEDRNPRLWLEEILDSIHAVVHRPTSDDATDRTMDDVASIAMRLHEVPGFLDELPVTISTGVPAPWRDAALETADRVAQTLPGLVDAWLTAHAVDPESVTWVREALRTALDALATTRQAITALPEVPHETLAFGEEAYAALLRHGCFVSTGAETLRARAQDELERLQALAFDGVTGYDDEQTRSSGVTPVLPAYAAQSANRVGRLAAMARSTFVDALPGAWLADAWGAYGAGFCDDDESPLDSDPSSLPHDMIRDRLALTVRAVVDLRLHTDALGFDEAVSLLEETLGLGMREAVDMTVDISMTPCRAVHAWLGAHALHQTRRLLLERGITDASAFSVRAMAFGAVPAPLLARLLLAA